LTFVDQLLGYSPNSVLVNIPKEYLVGFYGIILSFLVPSIARWINARRQGSYILKFMEDINTIYKSSADNKSKAKRDLKNIRFDIDDIFAQGKINKSHYDVLKDKISEYEKEIG